MDAHILFVLAYGNGSFSYAIESLTIEAGQVITFSSMDLETATESEMVDLINLLP